MTLTLAERRKDVLASLDVLRRKRGAAVLDGAPFDDNQIIAAEQEIDALAQAEIEAVRRERDDEATRLEELVVSLSNELNEKEEDRLVAIRQAEKGARELVAGLTAAFDAADSIRNLARRLGRPVPTKIDRPAMAGRLSQRLVAILATLPGHPYRFGSVEWRSCWRRAEDDWAACERSELSQDIDRLNGGE